jgi:hypothetical protein
VDAGGGRGLAASGNDPEIVTLAKAAAACPHDKADAHFRALLDPDCPAMKAWDKGERIMQVTSDATLLNMTEDTDPTVRWLGACGLLRVSSWRKDKASAARVVTATEAEKDKFVGYKLGLASATIDLKQTALADRVLALIQDAKRDPWLRGGVIAALGYNDPAAFPAIRDAIERVARKDDDAFLRQSAIRELAWHEPTKSCGLMLEFIHDPEGQVASSAVHGCLSKGCEGNIDPLLTETLRRAKAGEVKDESFAWALGEVGKSNPAPAMRTRLVSIAQEIVKNEKNSSLSRSRAMEVIGGLDPRAAAFAAKYTKDHDALVAAAAKKVALAVAVK